MFPGAFCRDLRLLLGLFELGLKLPGLVERLARFFGIPRESRPFDLQFRVHALFGCETRPVGLVPKFAGLFKLDVRSGQFSFERLRPQFGFQRVG